MSAIAATHERRTLPAAFWGMAVFVAAEATLFGVLIGSTFYLRFRHGAWPPAGIARPDWIAPVVLTAVLVATSAPLQIAYGSARAGRRRTAWWLLATAFAVQTAYFVWQLHDFVDEVHRVPPRESSYGSLVAVLLGADHFHVFVGLLLVGWLLLRLATGLTRYRLNGLMAAVFYWHAVNAITVLVLLTYLSPYA